MKEQGFEDMENSNVFDHNGVKIGEIVDFTFDQDFKLVDFVVKGTTDQDITKRLDVKKEDYYFLLPHDEIIDFGDDTINSTCQIDDLTIVHDLQKIEESLFSNINHYAVIDKNNAHVGHVIDVVFHKDDYFSFIVGGSYFREFLRKLGLPSKLHMLLPTNYIDKVKQNKIIINESKQMLTKILEEFKDKDIKRIRDQIMTSKDAEIGLRDSVSKGTVFR